MRPAGSVAELRAGAGALADVLAPAFLRKLDRVHLRVQRSLSTRPGNTPMPRGAQGSGIELESHRAYGAGDDLRHLDWNAYGRLDQLLIKTFRAEREAPLHLFVDASASMGAPAADDKFGAACALAAALAYVSLRNADPVRCVGVSAALPGEHLASPFFRHRDALLRLRDFLLRLSPRGTTALGGGIAAAVRGARLPGVAVVLSDFLAPAAACEAALSELSAHGFTVVALRVIGPLERDPSRLFRRGQLIDVESGQTRFVTLSRENLARYRRAVDEQLDRLRTLCHRCGVAFAAMDTAAGVEHCIFHELPALGLLR